MITVTTTRTNPNPNTIWNKLAAKLGREPTSAEGAAEVKRILNEASNERLIEQAGKGQLPWQRKR
jgi:hypothetical protein